MTERLKGHVALVTGGGRGIGRAISERLYREGAELAICGTSSDVLEETAKALQGEGRRSVFWRQCDVSSKESVRALVESAAEQFGKVDILVNNAAVTLGEFGKDRINQRFDKIDEALWDRNMEVNLKGPWLLAREVIPYMERQKWGRIINIGSSTVYFGRGNCAPYIASKAGLIGLTRALAFDVGGFGVTVNLVSLGLTMTERMQAAGYEERAQRFVAMTPMQRIEAPDDIPGTVLFFASDDSAFVTAQVISVDGGRSMH